MKTVNLALGSNIGKRLENLCEAARRIATLGNLTARSKIYSTKPWGIADQPDFLNAAVQLQTELQARDLLIALKSIEQEMGRKESVRWGPRLIDIDILTYGADELIDESGLKIPHPRMLERVFVLLPLADIEPAYMQELERFNKEELAELKAGASDWN